MALWLRKTPEIWRLRRAQRLEHPDLARLLDDERDLRAQDAQRRHEHDEKQQVKHHVLLHDQRAENAGIFLHPRCDVKIAAQLEFSVCSNCVFTIVRLIRIVEHHEQAVDRVVRGHTNPARWPAR